MKKLLYFLFVAIIFSALAGCSADSIETTDVELDEKILVYVSGPEAMINKLEEAFEEERGDVCDMLIMSCGQVRSKVWTEQIGRASCRERV